MAAMPVYFRIALAIMLVTTITVPVVAQPAGPLFESLQLKLAKPELKSKASYDGKDRALICGYCHGEDGNSVKPDVPNLAGQNPAYLLEQISRFASGERKDFVMNSLASKFTAEEQINLAIYYSGKRVKAERFNRKMAERGRAIFNARCQSCHGKQGMGNTGYARLAGQKQAYIKKTLSRFRDNNRTGGADKKRRSPVMEPIAAGLSDQDIDYLAAYAASLK